MFKQARKQLQSVMKLLLKKKARLDFEKEIAAAQAEAEAKATARQAIADRLGLTADELAVLLG